MTKTAHGGAFFRVAARIERIDLDHPAEANRLVAVVTGSVGSLDAGVKADVLVSTVVSQFPSPAASAARHPIARVLTRVITLVGEVASPVFLGSHVGAPGGIAVTAVVQRTAGHGAVGAVQGLDEIAAANRAVDLHRRQGGDATVHAVGLHAPLIVGALDDAYHGNTVGVHFLAHFVSRTQTANQRRRGTTGERNTLSRGVHQTRLNVLVVEHQQAVFRAVIDRVEVHTIVVRANLLGLIIAGVVHRKRRKATQDRCTPGNNHLVAVTLGHDDFIGGADGNSGKAQQVSSRRLTSVIIIVRVAVAPGQPQTEETQRSSASAALEYLTTGQAGLQHAGEQRVHLTGAQWLIPSPVVDIHQLITLFDGHRFLPLRFFGLFENPNRMASKNDRTSRKP